MRAANIALNFSNGLNPLFHVVPTVGYDLVSTTPRLIIRNNLGETKFDELGSAAGISVETIELQEDLDFGDGKILEAGEEVQAYKIQPDLSLAGLPDPDNKIKKEYRYGFFAGDDWGVQGTWTVYPDAGTVPGSRGDHIHAVSVGPLQIAVAVGGLPGPVGPPGSAEVGIRIISVSGSILSTDQSVIIIAGGADITLALPDPGDIYDTVTNKTKNITFFRPADDTGTVTLTGTAANLPDSLYPDEGGVIQSYGTALAVRW